MICKPCGDGLHEACKERNDPTWCGCQHRLTDKEQAINYMNEELLKLEGGSELVKNIHDKVIDKYSNMTEFCKTNCKENLAKNCDCYFNDRIKLMQE